MNRVDVTLSINGERTTAAIEPRTHLADFLRDERLLTGTHLGCEQGVCGACTLMVDGRPVRSCLTLAVACDGSDVRTIEGYDDDPLMARIRDAFMRHHGLQCGYCTPGMLATAYDIARRLPQAGEREIRKELSGNLCRCTGYAGIVAAIRDVIENGAPPASLQPTPPAARKAALGAIATPASAATEVVSEARTRQRIQMRGVDEPIDGETLSREVGVEAPLDKVWAIVRDLESVVSCIPGASLEEPCEGDRFTGTFTVALGPIKARFRGQGAVKMDDQAKSGRVSGSGHDALSKTVVDGAMNFKLARDGGARTHLALETTYALRGPLAQFGRKALVEEVVDRLLEETTKRLAAKASGEASPSSSAETPLNGFALIASVIKGLLRRLFGR